MTEKLSLCKCGCGQKVTKKENKYILGHYLKHNPQKGRKASQKVIQKQKDTIKIFGKGHRNTCLCGCGKKVKQPHSKYCLGHNSKHKPYLKGKTKENSETIRKILESRKWYRHSEKTKKIIGKKSEGNKHTKEYKKRLRQEMLNGKAAYLNQCMKNPSKAQVDLFNKTLKLCPYAILNYPCLNYSIDIAIPFLNIAIEYDGYYHFNSKENIEYHENRQKILEYEGWNFFRYNIYQKLPTLKQLEFDIKENTKF